MPAPREGNPRLSFSEDLGVSRATPAPELRFLLLSYHTPDNLLFPGWSQVSQRLPRFLTCPFPWSQGIQTSPGPVPGIC